jgi:hypothetical protein
MSLIQQLAPWLIWAVLFTTLAVVGGRRGTPGPVTNPRSLTAAAPAPQPAPTSDCRGDALSDQGGIHGQK